MKRAFLIFIVILSALACASETSVSGDISWGSPGTGDALTASVPVKAFLRTSFSDHINQRKAAALPEVMSAIHKGTDCENGARGAGNRSAAELTACRTEEEAASIAVFDRVISSGITPGASASTDANGKFLLKLPAAGEYMIIAHMNGGTNGRSFLFIKPLIVDGTAKTITLNENDLAEPASIAEMFR